ncbi:MAG: hypothetical protein HZB95_01385 [Nitrosomonadales bacterium]|nr:hypothetical protein [Nitrosomonadales bacterium]
MRLSAFVGRSFLDDDKKIWHDLRDILDSLKTMGFEYEDGKEGQIRPISEKVQELIMRHEIYIGILTKRYPIWHAPSTWSARWLRPLGSYTPQKWTTSEWVIEEVGFAIGKDRKVLLLIENGVNFPTSDLDGDTQWILFNRDNLSASQTEISQMVLHLISQRVTTIPEPASASTSASSGTEPVVAQKTPSFSEQLKTIKEHVLASRFTEAERIQGEITESETDPIQRSSIEAFLLYFRARNSDANALDRLKKRCADDPSDYFALMSLADAFSSFNDFKQAAKLLISNLKNVPQDQRSNLTIRAAQALCDDGNSADSIPLLLESLQQEEDEASRTMLYLEIAKVAERTKNTNLEMAFLERVLKTTPTDNTARFRLAYVSSESKLEKIAAYHYKLVVQHTNWPGASNNLGVAYGGLGFKSEECQLYKNTAEKYPLAKANLASLYASAGFNSDAKELANSALLAANDHNDEQLITDRAHYVLKEIANSEKTEKEAIEQLADDTKAEREFMCAYAEAYCQMPLNNSSGVYATPHGEIAITRELGKLKGEGTFTKVAPRGLLYALSGVAKKDTQEPEATTYTLFFSAQIHGQAGTFELNIAPCEKPQTLLGDQSRTIKGLLYFQDQGNTIQFLECDDAKRTVTAAQCIM